MECAATLTDALRCFSWCCIRAELTGNEQSQGWEEADVAEVGDFPRTSMLVLAAYEEDLSNPTPEFPAEAKALMGRVKVVKKTSYLDTKDRCPPYLIAVDHEAKDITVAVRGLNLGKVQEYFTLMDNRKGMQRFHDGYVHHGMLRSAGHLLDDEMDHLNELMLEHKEYTLTLAGHSLGSGVVCLMALVLLQNLEALSGITRDRIHCHCFAPPRCVSLNLAVSSADVISSIILQDDFLPRMNYPLETIIAFYFCLPCVLQWACCVDFFLPPEKLIRDPRRLYPPGRLYHIVYTEGTKCRVVESPPQPRVAVPVDGRFEKLVISRTTHGDHLLTTIYAQLGKMMEAMKEQEADWKSAPLSQRMDRMATIRREKLADLVHALERAKGLEVPNAFDPDSARRDEQELETAGLLQLEVEFEEKVVGVEPRVDGGVDRSMDRSILGKWSKIIDDAIVAENSKEEVSSRGKPRVSRNWSSVRNAVKEGKLVADVFEAPQKQPVRSAVEEGKLAGDEGGLVKEAAVDQNVRGQETGATVQT